MVERFLTQTTFTSQEDFIKNLHIRVPENFNFGYDVVDAWAAEETGPALDQRQGRVPPLHLRRHEARDRPHRRLLPKPRHRPRGHGDAHPETPLRILVQHHRPPQAGRDGHPRHPPADEEGHRLPLPGRGHQDDSLRRRDGHHRPHHRRHAPVAQREDPGQRRKASNTPPPSSSPNTPIPTTTSR